MSQIYLSAEYGIIGLRTPASLIGQSLRQADIRGRYGVTVLVVSRDEELIVSPQADFVL